MNSGLVMSSVHSILSSYDDPKDQQGHNRYAAVLHGCFNGALLVLVVCRGSHHQFLSFALDWGPVLRMCGFLSPVDKKNNHRFYLVVYDSK